jgi:hypothetical protein
MFIWIYSILNLLKNQIWKETSKSTISKIFVIYISNLSFKFILILKPQNSIFGKYRDLFEFENLFDLNSNLGFKFKFAE